MAKRSKAQATTEGGPEPVTPPAGWVAQIRLQDNHWRDEGPIRATQILAEGDAMSLPLGTVCRTAQVSMPFQLVAREQCQGGDCGGQE